MIRQVIGDEAKAIGNFWCFKQVSPLTVMASSCVLQQDRNASAGFFIVNAVSHSGQFKLYIATDRSTKGALRL